MTVAGDRMNLDRAYAVSQYVFAVKAGEMRRLTGFCKAIRIDGVRRRPDFFIISLIRLVGHNGCAFINKRAQAAGMIEMRMRVDQVVDRLVGDKLLGFGNNSL